MNYRLTSYPHIRQSRAATEVDWTAGEIAARLASPITHDAPKVDLPVFCPATFKGGHRLKSNVIAVSLLALDVDVPTNDPQGQAERIASTLGGVEVLAHSTWSSQPGAFRMRALVPYDRPATGEEHEAAWAFVARALRDEASIEVDGQCRDASRALYVPSMPPSGVYFHARIRGAPLPVGLVAEAESRWRAAKEEANAKAWQARPVVRHACERSAVERARRYLSAVPGAVSGQGGHAHTFTVAAKLVRGFGLSDVDALSLLSEWNRSCNPPWPARELARKVHEARQRSRAFTPGFLLETPVR